MKKTFYFILINLFISNWACAQSTELYKNTCHLFDASTDIVESGFISLNDSIIFTNYNDSVSVINVKNCKLIKRLNFKILSNFNTAVEYDLQSPVVSSIREQNKIWLRLILPDGQTWFGHLNTDFTFTKICQINTSFCLFVKSNGGFYACVHDGTFVNNGSSVKIGFKSGVIYFNESGQFLNAKTIVNFYVVNGGEVMRSIIYPILIKDKYNIYVGTSVNVPNAQGQRNSIYFGSQKIDCDQGGNFSRPYIILKMDTNFNLSSYFTFEGVIRHIKQNEDSLILFGTGGNVFIKNYGEIKSSVGRDYHYKLCVEKQNMKGWSICTIGGSGGTSAFGNPGTYYQNNSNFNYLTFKGTIYFDKPYASGGGQNVIFGFNKNNNCNELYDLIHINSQSDIGANLANSDNLNFVSICRSTDFWIGNNRINRGKGIYYFALNRDGQVDLSKISNTLYSNQIYKSNSAIQIGPNPCFGMLTLTGKLQNERIIIRDFKCNVILDRVVTLPCTLDLNTLRSGIYLIEFSNGNMSKIILNTMN